MIYSEIEKNETTPITMTSQGRPYRSCYNPYSSQQQAADFAYTDECLREMCLFVVDHDRAEYDQGSVTPPTPDWMKSDDENWYSDESDYEEERQRASRCQSIPIPIPIPATTPTTTTPATNVYDPNDPLRYFLTKREIGEDEYERWKIVHEVVVTPIQPRKKRIDFGPGHNSVSDDDSDDDEGYEELSNTRTTTTYGDGYSVLSGTGAFVDSWNPNPDPTPNRRYIALATSREFITRCLVDECGDHLRSQPQPQPQPQLASAFLLKLTWERYAFYPSRTPCWERYTLQNFWEEHALVIYEAMQTLVDSHARVHKGTEKMQANMVPPLYNITPIETLEATFETIGRMCRCIPEDFTTRTVTTYIEEFITALYREIVFITLIETRLCEQHKQE